MYTLLRKAVCVIATTASCLCITRAQSGFTITITGHEDGQGTLQNSTGFNAPLPSSLAPDPGPGGLASALTFGLLNPPGLIPGDVLLRDPSSTLSDIIRFNPTGVNPLGPTLVFYSELGGGDLADTGFPTAVYANNLSLAENTFGPTTYTPTAGEPGFVAGAGGPVTYVIFSSEVSGVPDTGSSALLLTFGMIALFLTAPRLLSVTTSSARID
jgi:hypothetical protein